MNILVLHDSNAIQGWLINEPYESAEGHVTNGYPDLLQGWQNGTVYAKIVTVPDEEVYRPDLYEVSGDSIVRKSE